VLKPTPKLTALVMITPAIRRAIGVRAHFRQANSIFVMTKPNILTGCGSPGGSPKSKSAEKARTHWQRASTMILSSLTSRVSPASRVGRWYRIDGGAYAALTS
jgi:hypothetical protein